MLLVRACSHSARLFCFPCAVLTAAVTQASLQSMLHKILTAGPSAFNITTLLSQAAQLSSQGNRQHTHLHSDIHSLCSFTHSLGHGCFMSRLESLVYLFIFFLPIGLLPHVLLIRCIVLKAVFNAQVMHQLDYYKWMVHKMFCMNLIWIKFMHKTWDDSCVFMALCRIAIRTLFSDVNFIAVFNIFVYTC